MKIAMLVGVVALASLAGCATNKSSGSAGAVKQKDCCAEGNKATCTDAKKADGSMGAVGEKSGCTEKKADGSMGAVSEKKAGCCSSAKQN
ncbi:hypothetical protein PHYC_01394 [Phycisphaerales bacterium]|nr:hypothetical protein PHYC_01394 [Phycisphaerales bacterium]